MRTTINLDEQLLAAAQRATGVTERSALIHEGLKGADRAGKRETAGAAWGYGTATGTGTAPPDGFRMILVDTSVWIDYFRRGEPVLASALEASEVMMHPFILGELACGNLKRRAEVLGPMRELPRAPTATEDEALGFIEHRRLMERGIGYIDAHLLASVVLAGTARLWTRDKRLAIVAENLGRAFAANRNVPATERSEEICG